MSPVCSAGRFSGQPRRLIENGKSIAEHMPMCQLAGKVCADSKLLETTPRNGRLKSMASILTRQHTAPPNRADNARRSNSSADTSHTSLARSRRWKAIALGGLGFEPVFGPVRRFKMGKFVLDMKIRFGMGRVHELEHCLFTGTKSVSPALPRNEGRQSPPHSPPANRNPPSLKGEPF
jgi:hypothetical protein